jgi:hypothetical protein
VVFCGWCTKVVIVYALERNVKYHELLDINKEKLHITRSDLSKVNKNMHRNTKFNIFLKVSKCIQERSVCTIHTRLSDWRVIFYLGPYVKDSLNLCFPPFSRLLARLSSERTLFTTAMIVSIVWSMVSMNCSSQSGDHPVQSSVNPSAYL